MKGLKEWGGKLAIAVLALLWLCIVAASWGEAAENDSDDYNFSWLDPDKKIYVLQNRRYLKTNHMILSVLGGPGTSNPYRSTLGASIRAAYYGSESFGIEPFYTAVFNRENNTFQALKENSPNSLPVVREVRSQYGVMAHWVPWYAKINVFNSILYFDWYFAGGAGGVRAALDTRTKTSAAPSYVYQDYFALFASTGHHYHISDHFLARIDFTGAFYQAPLYGLTGDKSWYSNYLFGIGIGYKL